MAKRKKNIVKKSNTLDLSKFNYEEIVRDAVRMQSAVQHIPAMVKEEIEKGWKQLPNVDPKRSPKSWFFDPLSLQYSLGYKDRKYSLTYDVIKRVVNQLPFLNAIINTRCAQVATFSEPYRTTRSLGYVIKHKDPDHPTTAAEVAFIKELESFIGNCGRLEKNPYSKVPRDDFETFIRKLVRDSLSFDSACIEIIPDNLGIPYEFYAVDASTIRIAADTSPISANSSYHQREGFIPEPGGRYNQMFQGHEYGQDVYKQDQVSYVQVLNGQIENVYSNKELAFGVRNPRTDVFMQGYGYGEVEMSITIITAMLNAEEYNRKFFQNGTSSKGILNMKGDSFSPEMLDAMKRQWAAQAQGVDNSHKTLFLQSSEGIEWIDLQKSNNEMEFAKWLEYLIKTLSGIYMIDPAELNFAIQGGVSQTPLFESSQEWKLKASKDKGLKPLLKFIAKLINKNIIDQIDDHFMLEFVGLDELSELEKHELLVEQIGSYLTLNEARRKLDLPELGEIADWPMNPTLFSAMTTLQQIKQMDQQMEQDQQAQQAPSSNSLPGGDPTVEDPGPQYAGNFGKTLLTTLDLKKFYKV